MADDHIPSNRDLAMRQFLFGLAIELEEQHAGAIDRIVSFAGSYGRCSVGADVEFDLLVQDLKDRKRRSGR